MATPNLTFGVKSQNGSYPANKSPPHVTGTINSVNLGATSAAISAIQFQGHTLIVNPTLGSQTYTLPTATQLLNEYGVNLDSGIPKLTAGALHNIHIINRSTNNSVAYIAANPTGGDGSVVLAYAPTGGNFNGIPLSTGAALTGKLTNIYLQWTNVASGTNGASGSYTIY